MIAIDDNDLKLAYLALAELVHEYTEDGNNISPWSVTKLKWERARRILLAPAPHDAAKEKTMTPTEGQIVRKDTSYDSYPTDAAGEVSPSGITSSANPTSGGKVEQDAAGEDHIVDANKMVEREPELPQTVFLNNGTYYENKWKYHGEYRADISMNHWTADDLEAIAQHMRYRQRLQDKREARDRSLIADIQKSVPSLDGFSARRIIEAVREHDAKEAK